MKTKMNFIALLFACIALQCFSQATGIEVANMPTGGNLNNSDFTGAATWNFNQTTAGQTINIPDVSPATNSKICNIRHKGSVPFTLTATGVNIVINPGDLYFMQWQGAAYAPMRKLTSADVSGVLGYTPVNPSSLATVATSGSYNDLSNKPSIPASPSFNNAPSMTIQTVAAAANGSQVSTTRGAIVHYSVTVSSATQIGIASNVAGYVVLEICATNSSTASDWIEIARTGNGQNIGLAVALSLTTTSPAELNGVIPAGYYRRLRSINTSGTPSYTYNSGQEVLVF